MSRQTILDTVSRILSEELQSPGLALTAGARLADLEGWDSVTGSCVMICIENEFGFEFDGNVLDLVTTADSLVDMIERKQTAS